MTSCVGAVAIEDLDRASATDTSLLGVIITAVVEVQKSTRTAEIISSSRSNEVGDVVIIQTHANQDTVNCRGLLQRESLLTRSRSWN